MQATQRDILNFSVGAKGFWQPIANYAGSKEYQRQPPKVIVWEIPERYLAFEAPLQWAISSFPALEAQVSHSKNDCVKSFTTCNKHTTTMNYMFDWHSIDVVGGTGIYRSAANGFFDREGTIRHAGPDSSQVSFWLRSPEKVTLSYALGSPFAQKSVQIFLNGKQVQVFGLAKDTQQQGTLTLNGRAGPNQLEFRYSDWNTKTTTFASGDTRKIAVTFSKLLLQH